MLKAFKGCKMYANGPRIAVQSPVTLSWRGSITRTARSGYSLPQADSGSVTFKEEI
jgi:hypothetical protein